MIKIMLVEDDKSLREIYGVRLLAEGYDIVSAGDGEEALAMAIKERPQLILSDVMMPKISGFDMLDILRSTTETKNIRVIMMTALSSEEQRLRGEQLGADRYLVKSQVGIEDVVRVVHEVLGDTQPAAAAPAPQPTPAAAPPQPQPEVRAQPPVFNPVPAAPVAPTAPALQPQPTTPQAAPTPPPVPSSPLQQ
ncbi:MAG TPA: response regulator, partial [Candidatus Nitrosotenuis sp.]|nr:response regulator [Candidatus Nitrosotenuis sp.]